MEVLSHYIKKWTRFVVLTRFAQNWEKLFPTFQIEKEKGSKLKFVYFEYLALSVKEMVKFGIVKFTETQNNSDSKIPIKILKLWIKA